MSGDRFYVEDQSNELIYLTEGWCSNDRGWFCRLERRGISVEAFGSTKRQALRIARRFWYKSADLRESDCILPRVVG